MRYIFFYNEKTFAYIGADTISDNAQVPANATTVEPVDENGVGLFDPVWNSVKQRWEGITEDEWKTKHGVVEEPSLEQKLQAKQTVLIAGLAKNVQTLQGAVRTLVMQNAMNSKEEK